jgi:hypothetical protein
MCCHCCVDAAAAALQAIATALLVRPHTFNMALWHTFEVWVMKS